MLGDLDDLEQVVADLAEAAARSVTRLVLTPSALVPEAKPETILMRARRLGLATSRLPSLDDGGEALRLAPVNVEDLLLRPSVKIDYRRLETVRERQVDHRDRRRRLDRRGNLRSHRHLRRGARAGDREFGAGAACRAGDARDQECARRRSKAASPTCATASRIFRLIADFRPDIVFHAAALKHVPLLERDWGEGVKTNVFGSVNVADAAAAAGAAAMVMISTDKAIEPVSVLGASKRFAEMYCQALDNDFARRGDAARRAHAADRGALRQRARLERLGGAEVQGADRGRRAGHGHASRHGALLHDDPRGLRPRGHGGEPRARAGHRGVAVYVLNMGQPVKIVDLAERMIRLSGLEPGRDIDITFTGIRPGERLHEILFAREEPTAPIGIDGIVAAKPGQSVARSDARLAGGAGAGACARGPLGDLRRAARRGAGFRRRGGVSMAAVHVTLAARKRHEQPGDER